MKSMWALDCFHSQPMIDIFQLKITHSSADAFPLIISIFWKYQIDFVSCDITHVYTYF